MAVTVNWPTGVINIPQADLTLVSGTLYELDVNALRLALKNLEDDEAGQPWPTTHNHNTEIVLSGVTYARSFEIINGYTVTFQDTGSPYTVRATGANHNLADVTNFTSEVSLIVGNSAGLITSGSGGASAEDIAAAVWAAIAASNNTVGSMGEKLNDAGSAANPWTEVIESGYTAAEILRLLAAVMAGRSAGGGTTGIEFTGLNGSTVRVDATVDSNGNRTAVTLNPT